VVNDDDGRAARGIINATAITVPIFWIPLVILAVWGVWWAILLPPAVFGVMVAGDEYLGRRAARRRHPSARGGRR
jgi:hypothetical protein